MTEYLIQNGAESAIRDIIFKFCLVYRQISAKIAGDMYKRLFALPKQSCFIFGARGTGKTTLLKSEVQKAHFVNLLDEKKFQSYLSDIDLFRREVDGCPRQQIIVVDEVQRLPSLLNTVHDLIESDKRRFILTGSSARKLRQKGVNLLAGRAVVKHMYPLLPTELSSDFDLIRALSIGTLPLVLASQDPKATLEAYTLTYLREEIKAEALVKNLPGFSRFLNVAALFHGQVVNVSSIARDSGVARTTVQGFFEILEDTLIGSFLPAYQAKPKLREIRHPKFYFFDSGILRSIKHQFGPIDADEKGFLFEGFVYHCLKAYNAYLGIFDEIFFWSSHDSESAEVDFILRSGKELTAIEVKAKTHVRPEDAKGLKAVSNLKGVKNKIIVHMGSERQKLHDGIIALPFGNFCEKLAKGKLAD